MLKILAFGEVLWDVFPDEKCIGGAPFNFAAHCARLGADVSLLTAVGKDALGEETLAAIRENGVRADYVSCSSLPTGKCVVTLDENAVPSYDLWENVAYDDIALPEKTEPFDVLYFGTLSLRGAHNRAVLRELLAKNAFADVFVDVNIRPPFYSRDSVLFALENATILKISDEELPTVLSLLHMQASSEEACARALCKAFPALRIVLITKGGEGAYLYSAATEKSYNGKAVAAAVVSTVGAGDSFSAAFLCAPKKEADLAEAMAFASRVAAFVVSKKGAVPPYQAADFL